MKYIPDTCNIDSRLDEEMYLILQVKYRNGFIKYLSSFINFDELINEMKNNNIPVIEDKEYNFYHNDYLINSDYLFIRNNIHIENLSDEDLSYLQKFDNEDDMENNNFYNRTYKNVMFEPGEYVSYGLFPNDSNIKKSNAIVFEFAYDQKKCESLEQLNKIKETIKNTSNKIKQSMNDAGIECDFIEYKAIPELFSIDDLYKEEMKKQRKG